MSKQVAKAQESSLPANVQAEMLAEWGVGHIDKSDVIIPKLFVLQSISKAVVHGEASAGQIVDSLKYEVFGDLREKFYKPLKFVAFLQYKNILEHEVVYTQNKRELRYLGTKLSSEVGELPKLSVVDGKEIERTRQLNFYIFALDQLEDDTKLPMLLTFRKTSYNAGKILLNHFSDCGHAQAMIQQGKKIPVQKAIPAAKVFELHGKIVTNDKGSFYVPEVKEASDTVSQEGMLKAFRWYKMLSAGKDAAGNKIRTDDRDDDADVVVTPSEDVSADF